MGILWWIIKALFFSPSRKRGAWKPTREWDIRELATRLELPVDTLQTLRPQYRTFTIPKHSGASRRIDAPDDATKDIQTRILKTVVSKFRLHPAAHGFRVARGITGNAKPHVGRAIVIRLDIRDFFPSISGKRIADALVARHWSREAAECIATLCTVDGRLPQGAPTSPALSNLVCHRLDARLAGLVKVWGKPDQGEDPIWRYTRYADDLTFSASVYHPGSVRGLCACVKRILREEGFHLHASKTKIMRPHHRQIVTGLVVNERINLPRHTRRQLRAVRHRLQTGAAEPTLTREQMAGWSGMLHLVAEAQQDARDSCP